MLERGEFSLRLLWCKPIADSADRAKVTAGPASWRRLSFVSQWTPDLDAFVEGIKYRLKVGRHYSNDRAFDTAQQNGFSHERKISIEAFFPKFVTNNYYRRRIRTIVFVDKAATNHWFRSEHAKEICCHSRASKGLRVAFAR